MSLPVNSDSKVLLVVRQLGSTGGVERRVDQLKQASFQSSMNIKVFSFLGKLETYNQGNASKWTYLKRLLNLVRQIRSYKPDVVHAFDLESGIYCAMALKLFPLSRIKFISGYGAEFVGDARIRRLLGMSFFHPKVFTCNSKKGKEDLERITKGKVDVKIIYNGIKLGSNSDISERPKWATEGKLVIGCISKFDHFKRADRILELIDNLPKDLPFHFVVIGTGKDYDVAVKRWRADERYQECVSLIGVVPDAWKYIAWFDIGVLVSDSEGFPTVLLEYMNFSKPIVATGAGETNEILANGKAGVVHSEWDVKKFSKSLISLLEDKNLRKELGDKGKKRFDKEYTFERMRDNYFRLYKSSSKY